MLEPAFAASAAARIRVASLTRKVVAMREAYIIACVLARAWCVRPTTGGLRLGMCKQPSRLRPARAVSPIDVSVQPARLMLDEMLSPRMGQLLCRSGIDCVSLADDRPLCARDDEAVLAVALTARLIDRQVAATAPLPREPSAVGGDVLEQLE